MKLPVCVTAVNACILVLGIPAAVAAAAADGAAVDKPAADAWSR